MRRKVISGLLCAAMTVTMLAGCGPKKDDSGTNASSNDVRTTEDTEADDGNAAAEDTSGGDYKLTVWCWDPAYNINAMEEAAKIYHKDHPSFKVEIVDTPWKDIQTKLTTAASGGDYSILPDIFLMPNRAFQKNMSSYPDAAIDLTDSGIDFTQFREDEAAYSVVGGKHYGVPFHNGTAIAAYRTDILEKAGYTIDDFTDITWDDYLEKGKVVLEKTGKPLLSCQTDEPDLMMTMLQSCAASLFDGEGNPAMEGNEALKKVMETYTALKQAGVLTEVKDEEQYISTITAEAVAGAVNECRILASIREEEEQSGKWAVTNLPSLSGVDNAANYANYGGTSWVISSNCQNVELAKDFLADTFAGSVELYENIVSSGAIAAYLPAAESDIYAETENFFSGWAVSEKLAEFAAKSPVSNTGVYYDEACGTIAAAIQDIEAGADIDEKITEAEKTIKSRMQ